MRRSYECVVRSARAGANRVLGHCERARTAGAEIVEEPEDQVYGERRYGAVDPEGQRWYFGQVVREVTPEDWGADVSSST